MKENSPNEKEIEVAKRERDRESKIVLIIYVVFALIVLE